MKMKLYSIGNVAKILKLTTQAIWLRVKKGNIVALKVPSKTREGFKYRIHWKDLPKDKVNCYICPQCLSEVPGVD